MRLIVAYIYMYFYLYKQCALSPKRTETLDKAACFLQPNLNIFLVHSTNTYVYAGMNSLKVGAKKGRNERKQKTTAGEGVPGRHVPGRGRYPPPALHDRT